MIKHEIKPRFKWKTAKVTDDWLFYALITLPTMDKKLVKEVLNNDRIKN